MYKQPLSILCVCFILGIFFQDFFSLKLNAIYFLLGISFSTLIIFFVKIFFIYRLRFISLFLFFFFLGIYGHFLNTQKPDLPTLHYKENLVFKITKKLNSNEKNRRYEIVAWKDNKYFLAVLSVPKTHQNFDFKNYYQSEIYLQKIENPYSDFQFDYAKYLARKHIYYQGYLGDSYSAGARKSSDFSEKIMQKRLETLVKIDNTHLSKRTRELMKGIILADRTEMDKETVQDFSRSGLVHILAISGSHMAIIFWLILLVLNPLFPPKFRFYKIIISLILIWMFAIFIDYGNSVVRSCMMISAYYIFILLQRKPDLVHAMGIAAFTILILNTNQLFDVGFQLSFLAVLGIFWFNQPVLKYLPSPKNNFQNFMVNIVSISISAQLATLPLVVYYFHQYSFISIIANLVIIPFSEILIIFSLLMAVLISFSVEFIFLNGIYEFFVTSILEMIHVFAEVDFAFFDKIPMTLLEVIVAFILIFYLHFAILKFNTKNSLRVLYFILLFVSVRLVLNYKAKQIDEVLVHQYFDYPVISVKKGNHIKFVISENLPLEKIEKYIIDPYLTSRRTKEYELTLVPKEIEKIKIRGNDYFLK
ncbi:ComEC/Rec2 family competence protein [Chryseobacterium sp. MP_3.2]|uniref:ComEC/Rec2 family competence protein n=1 Tax=Chryseobacterium sp. MP_3.2 TaxID=3071712 RepID=UPI002E079652|nr:competence protein ComEC [Chryseobacterium sp. MP_3.2]